LIGAVISGVVTFSSTYYFQDRARMLDHQQALVSAQNAERAALRERTWQLYREWQSERLAAARATVADELGQHPDHNIDDWRNSDPSTRQALDEVLRFYTELRVANSADQLDEPLMRELFDPYFAWANEELLPPLCRGHSEPMMRFDGAVYDLFALTETNVRACQESYLNARDSGPRPCNPDPRQPC
jgi:hypothetical protein